MNEQIPHRPILFLLVLIAIICIGLFLSLRGYGQSIPKYDPQLGFESPKGKEWNKPGPPKYGSAEPSIADNFITWSSNAVPDYAVALFYSGDVLLTEDDPSGKRLVTVYRDGHIEAADPKRIDEASREFWKLFAKSFPQFCTEAKQQ